jgi:heme O synthase-like polyprenyltransferase
LPVVDRAGTRTFRQILLAAAVLIPVSLLPAVTGLASVRYFFGAGVVGILIVALCLWAAAEKTNTRAKWLMHATVIQLPLLLGLLWWDKIPR